MLWSTLAWVSLASAQTPSTAPDVDAQLYHPNVDSTELMWTESTGRMASSQGETSARLALHWVHEPLMFQDENGQYTALVRDAFQLDAVGAYSFDRVRLAVDVPIILFAAGDLSTNGGGAGDLAIDGRVLLLDSNSDPIGMALSLRGELPTSTISVPVGLGGPQLDIAMLIDGRLDGGTLAFNVGQTFGPRQELDNVLIDDSFFARLGGGVDFTDDFGGSADLAMRGYYGPDLGQAIPMEAMLGAWVRPDADWVMRAGAGRGLTAGVGSPAMRIVTQLVYAPEGGESEPKPAKVKADGDRDGDGIADSQDSCADLPEDPDGFKDDDGCPDDEYKVAVKVVDPKGNVMPRVRYEVMAVQWNDAGEAEVELHEGEWEIKAVVGGYGSGSATVNVPDVTETVIVVEPDAKDLSALTVIVKGLDAELLKTAEVLVGGEKLHPGENGFTGALPAGKYTAIVQGDRIKSGSVEFVLENAEAKTVEIEATIAKVEVVRGKIEISEKIFFKSGSAEIRKVSFPLLDEVAEVLTEHDEVKNVRIDGHTDSVGGAESNLKLSEARAASVLQYLVDKGVERHRLTSKGFGETKLIDQGTDADAHSRNRRVEFTIVYDE